MKIGTPSSDRNCLGVSPPMRTPVPAAGIMARTLMTRRLRTRSLCRVDHFGGSSPFVVAAEDHASGSCLKHTGDGNVDGLGEHFLGIVHHHHGPIIQVGYALIVLFTLFEDVDPHGFA